MGSPSWGSSTAAGCHFCHPRKVNLALGIAPSAAPISLHTSDQRAELNRAATRAGSLLAQRTKRSHRHANSPLAAPGVQRHGRDPQRLRRKEVGQVDLLLPRKATGCIPGSAEEAAGSPLVSQLWFCGERPQMGEAVADSSAKHQR